MRAVGHGLIVERLPMTRETEFYRQEPEDGSLVFVLGITDYLAIKLPWHIMERLVWRAWESSFGYIEEEDDE